MWWLSTPNNKNTIIEASTLDLEEFEHLNIEFIDENIPFHSKPSFIDPLDPLLVLLGGFSFGDSFFIFEQFSHHVGN
jgi:hypothetical protein